MVSAGFCTSALAIERLTPIQEPDESVAQLRASSAKARTVEKPWLGVAGQPIEPSMAERLGLTHGVTIELVSPNGSAAQAGIQKFDVITAIDGKKITNMGDLKQALHQAQVGEDVAITCLSEGEVVTKSVTLQARPSHLARRELQMPEAGESQPKDRSPQAIPHSMRHLPSIDQQRIREMMQARTREMEERMAQLQKQFLQDSWGDSSLTQGAHGSFSSSFSLMDDQGSVNVKSDDENGKHITVKDRQGNVVFSGPYETAADREAVPADVRARVDALGVNRDAMSKGTAGMSFFPFGR
nr:PDZ domain-containing protein [Rubritalea marina]